MNECHVCTDSAVSAVRCEGHHNGLLALCYLVTGTQMQAWRLHHSL